MTKEKAIKMSSTLLFLSSLYLFIKVVFALIGLGFLFGYLNLDPIVNQPSAASHMMMNSFFFNVQPGNLIAYLTSSVMFLAGGIILLIASRKIKIALNTFVWSVTSIVTLFVVYEVAYLNSLVLYIGLFASIVTLYFADRK